jgi:glycosyltransferase involved in cell wall biosynthesis
MKILLINKFLYPKGGDAICSLATGKLLEQKGHQVVYWGMQHPDNPEYQYKNYFVDNVDYLKKSSLKKQIQTGLNVLYSFEAKKKVEHLVIKEEPDLVHLNNFAHQISPSILHVFKKHRIPVVMTMHDFKLVCPVYSLLSNYKVCEKCSRGRYYHCLLNRCTKDSLAKSFINTAEMYLHHNIMQIYKLIDVYIAPSKFLKDKVIQMGFKARIEHLSNFIDDDQSQTINTPAKKEIIYFGRLHQEKGLITLIKAVEGLDIKLKIIGEGPQKSELESLIKEKEFTNIELKGYMKKPQLKKEINNASFTVLPSESYENNPLSVIESFALEKPVIGSRLGGIPELVQDEKTGLTFTPGDSADLCKKINYLISQPEKIAIMGKNARLFVEQEFDRQKHYEQLLKIYQSVIKR